jgi:hypothetical protein
MLMVYQLRLLGFNAVRLPYAFANLIGPPPTPSNGGSTGQVEPDGTPPAPPANVTIPCAKNFGAALPAAVGGRVDRAGAAARSRGHRQRHTSDRMLENDSGWGHIAGAISETLPEPPASVVAPISNNNGKSAS